MCDCVVFRRAEFARTSREVRSYAARRTSILRAAYDKEVGGRIKRKAFRGDYRASRGRVLSMISNSSAVVSARSIAIRVCLKSGIPLNRGDAARWRRT